MGPAPRHRRTQPVYSLGCRSEHGAAYSLADRFEEMRTYQQTTAEATHDWYIVDAAGQRLGTLAVRIARALSGRKKPTWTPHIDDGDFVVVINAEKIELGGNKWNQKVYHRHSGFPGGLRTETAAQVRAEAPRAADRARRSRHAGDQPDARRTARTAQRLCGRRRIRTRRRSPRRWRSGMEPARAHFSAPAAANVRSRACA